MACSTSYGNGNCNAGGFPVWAYNYIKAKGAMRGSDYPYEFKAGACKYDSSKVVTRVTGTKRTTGGELGLKSALAQGVVTVIVDASRW